ncbi:MAG: T9SS type A sorting domain-containing protein [Bacteroidia bacterium]|nr:T9SS type A sorting domain-containing protein [Bacteroidia bacterium]
MRSDLDAVEESEDLKFEVFPNPARKEITSRFVLAAPALARLSLYDISGHFIQDLYRSGTLDAGTHQVTCTLENMQVGYYHVVLRVNKNVVRKLIHIVL